MTVEELEEKGFVLLDELDHQRLVPFIREQLSRSEPAKWFFVAATLLPLCCAVALAGWLHARGLYPLGNSLSGFGSGIIGTFLLIPFHEYIHVLAYRSQGATNTSYGADWKRFVFMALADRFVADRTAFRVIALAPYVVISALLIIPMPFVPPYALFALLGSLVMHTGACSGDFGLLAYFEHHKDKEVVTYDEVDSKRSFFLGREPPTVR